MENIPIFIFSSGQRCGSTFLQRLINSTNQGIIWGEHYGYLNHLLHGYKKLVWHESVTQDEKKNFHEKGIETFAPNIIKDFNLVKNSFKDHIYSLFSNDNHIWGFKEVRYEIDVAIFLQHLFPHAKIIHLTRNYVDCFISLKHWEKETEFFWNRRETCEMLDMWARINYSFYKCKDELNDFISIRYEDIFRDIDGFIQKLSVFLEVDENLFDKSVFHKRLYDQKQMDLKDTRPKIKPNHLSDSEIKLLTRKHLLKVAEIFDYEINF